MQCGYLMIDLVNPSLWLVSHHMTMNLIVDGCKSYTSEKINEDSNSDKYVLYFNMFPNHLR